ncbi:MAG: nucleoside hydrolase [Methylacidiphilales bacterium]|nr:nucleoside hydrolase [Candidatus Methylacidiphilales bacterium]
MPQTISRRRVILDTDTYNEVDDQFALAHLLLSPDEVEVEAVYAAPFSNDRSSGPADGMEKSYEEILRVIDLVDGPRPPVFRGSTSYLPGPAVPVKSAAAADLVERALAMKEGERLYVAGIAAATNLASALLLEPKIADRIELVWLGGHGPHWPHTREFNLHQDLHAARVLLDSPVPLVLLPCHPVTSHLIVTVPELEKHLAPHSKLGAYLTDIVRHYGDDSPGWSKVIWDISASAWLVHPGWIVTSEEPSPLLRDDATWGDRAGRRPIQIAHELYRDAIFADFYAKAARAGKQATTR